MKKTYINPKMEIVEIKVQQFLAASLPTSGDPADPGSSDAPEYEHDDF